MRNEDEYFATSDFYLAAFCIAAGLALHHIDRANPRRVSFVFWDSKGRKGLVEEFLLGRATIEPKALISAIKKAKQLLHQDTV